MKLMIAGLFSDNQLLIAIKAAFIEEQVPSLI